MADLSFDDLMPPKKELSFDDLMPAASQAETPVSAGKRGTPAALARQFMAEPDPAAEKRAAEMSTPEARAQRWEDVGEKWKEVGKNVAVGVPAGIVGMPGDIESLARLPLRPLGVSGETLLPTSERVATAVMGEPETEYEKYGRTVGGLLAPSALGKILGLGARSLIGAPSTASARLAREAEKMGITVEPMQVRAAAPAGSPGLTEKAMVRNQEIYNREASRATGVETNNISPKFLEDRAKALGLDYDILFARDFKITDNLANAVLHVVDFERKIIPQGSSKISGTARNILNIYTDPKLNNVIHGTVLHKLREGLSEMSRSLSGSSAHDAWKLVREFDAAIAETAPDIAKKFADTNRKYRATMTLKDLASKADNPGIFQNNISPEILGAAIAGDSRHPLAKLGEMGRALQLRAIWQSPEGAGKGLAEALVSKAGRVLAAGVGARSQAARAVQRHMTPVMETPRQRVLTPSGIATLVTGAGRAVEQPESEE
jgi:hypothetical protein